MIIPGVRAFHMIRDRRIKLTRYNKRLEGVALCLLLVFGMLVRRVISGLLEGLMQERDSYPLLRG